MIYPQMLFVAMTVSLQLVSADLSFVYPEVGVSEYRLHNGLKVLIQNNELDKGEVFIRVFSHGGYAHENTQKEKELANENHKLHELVNQMRDQVYYHYDYISLML